MGMALRCDVVDACRAAGTEKPIDLAFLSAQTMGDSSLEKDLLNLFIGQTSEFSAAVSDASDNETTSRLAHTIKGAARSIGAFRLAELAENAEKRGKFDSDAMINEMNRVCEYISSLR